MIYPLMNPHFGEYDNVTRSISASSIPQESFVIKSTRQSFQCKSMKTFPFQYSKHPGTRAHLNTRPSCSSYNLGILAKKRPECHAVMENSQHPNLVAPILLQTAKVALAKYTKMLLRCYIRKESSNLDYPSNFKTFYLI
jgi:hypothetical protein